MDYRYVTLFIMILLYQSIKSENECPRCQYIMKRCITGSGSPENNFLRDDTLLICEGKYYECKNLNWEPKDPCKLFVNFGQSTKSFESSKSIETSTQSHSTRTILPSQILTNKASLSSKLKYIPSSPTTITTTTTTTNIGTTPTNPNTLSITSNTISQKSFEITTKNNNHGSLFISTGIISQKSSKTTTKTASNHSQIPITESSISFSNFEKKTTKSIIKDDLSDHYLNWIIISLTFIAIVWLVFVIGLCAYHKTYYSGRFNFHNRRRRKMKSLSVTDYNFTV